MTPTSTDRLCVCCLHAVAVNEQTYTTQASVDVGKPHLRRHDWLTAPVTLVFCDKCSVALVEWQRETRWLVPIWEFVEDRLAQARLDESIRNRGLDTRQYYHLEGAAD